MKKNPKYDAISNNCYDFCHYMLKTIARNYNDEAKNKDQEQINRQIWRKRINCKYC